MKKKDWSRYTKQCFISFAVLSVFMISSCSNSEEEQSIEQTRGNIAREAVDRIQLPIEKAKSAKKLLEMHDQEIQKAQERQE